MSQISVIIIAKNEEENIKKCLESVDFCDELVVIDNGSADKTKEIAKSQGAQVYSLETNNFSKLRDLGLEKAKGDWVLYIDADEIISKELRDEIVMVINSKEARDVYKLRRKNFYYGNHEWPYIEETERLFKRKSLKGWKGVLHESPVVAGEKGELENFLLHYTHQNLSKMVEKTIEWSKLEAKLRLDAGHPKMAWWRFPRVMISAFYDSYVRQKGWKAGTVGIIESMYQSFSIFVTYARLWEMQKNQKK